LKDALPALVRWGWSNCAVLGFVAGFTISAQRILKLGSEMKSVVKEIRSRQAGTHWTSMVNRVSLSLNILDENADGSELASSLYLRTLWEKELQEVGAVPLLQLAVPACH
jgi:hypothetical protein